MTRNDTFRSMCVFAGLVVTVGTASGQTQAVGQKRGDTSATDPIGIPLGEDWRLFPLLDISERYDDNIFATSEDEESDFVSLIRPELRFERETVAGALTLRGFGDIQIHADNSREDAENFGFEAGYLSAADRPLEIDFSSGFSRETRDRSDPEEIIDRKRSTVNRFFGRPVFRYHFARVGFGIGGEVRRLDFTQAFNRDRDRTEFSAFGEIILESSPVASFFLSPEWRAVRHDDSLDRSGLDRDREEASLVAGARLDSGGPLSGDFEAGVARMTFDDSGFEDFTTFTGKASLHWKPTGLTTVTLFADREAEATTQAEASSRIDSEIGLRLDHELLRTLLLNAEVAFRNQDFRNIERDDDFLDLTAGFSYLLGRKFVLYGEYRYRQRRSGGAALDFERNRVGIGIKLQI